MTEWQSWSFGSSLVLAWFVLVIVQLRLYRLEKRINRLDNILSDHLSLDGRYERTNSKLYRLPNGNWIRLKDVTGIHRTPSKDFGGSQGMFSPCKVRVELGDKAEELNFANNDNLAVEFQEKLAADVRGEL